MVSSATLGSATAYPQEQPLLNVKKNKLIALIMRICSLRLLHIILLHSFSTNYMILNLSYIYLHLCNLWHLWLILDELLYNSSRQYLTVYWKPKIKPDSEIGRIIWTCNYNGTFLVTNNRVLTEKRIFQL